MPYARDLIKEPRLPQSPRRFALPHNLMDLTELYPLLGYRNTQGARHAIWRGQFPIPTFKYGQLRVAKREDVKAYFQGQSEAAEEVRAEQHGKFDKLLARRVKATKGREVDIEKAEMQARKLAQAQQKVIMREAIARQKAKGGPLIPKGRTFA